MDDVYNINNKKVTFYKHFFTPKYTNHNSPCIDLVTYCKYVCINVYYMWKNLDCKFRSPSDIWNVYISLTGRLMCIETYNFRRTFTRCSEKSILLLFSPGRWWTVTGSRKCAANKRTTTRQLIVKIYSLYLLLTITQHIQIHIFD